MDYGSLSENVLKKLQERQYQLRAIENEDEKRVQNLFFGQDNYKREYYKDVFRLENKLQQFQRQDLMLKEADILKREKLNKLLADRKDLKQHEDMFYHQIERPKTQYLPNGGVIPNNNPRDLLVYQTPQPAPQKSYSQSQLWETRKSLAREMPFEQLKDYRLLNEKLPTMEEIKNQHLLQLQKFFNKSPYSNNMMNLLQENEVGSERQIVAYLKSLQNDASLQATMFQHGSAEYAEKQKQMELLKQMLQFIEQKNPFRPQKELQVDPFDSEQVFHINWDIVKVVPPNAKRIKINYGIFKKETTFFTYRSTADIYTHNPNYLDLKDGISARQVALINEHHVIKHLLSKENAILYLDLWILNDTEEKVTKYGWSILDVFDSRGHFLPGKYKIPFYPKEMKPHSLFQNGLRYLQDNCFVYINLQTANQAFELSKQHFDFESDYYVPPLHQKPPREEILYQPDALAIFTSADDTPHYGIARRAKQEQAQLTFEAIIKECQEVILEAPLDMSRSSLSSSNPGDDIPSLKDIRNKQKAGNDDRKGFEFSITGFNNVFFATTDFLKVKGVFMKYDKIIIDEDNKTTVNSNMVLVNSREGYDENVQSAEKQHENEYYLFYCVYNHNDKLIGWTDVDLFDVEDSRIVLKEGKFNLQLFNPPLLMPPFLGHTKTTSIIEIKYEISGNQKIQAKNKQKVEKQLVMIAAQRRAGRVDNSDLLQQQYRKSQEEMTLDNPKQFIRIELFQLKNYPLSKNTIGCFIKFMLNGKVLKDLDRKNIQEFETLETQPSPKKDTLVFSHQTDIRVNLFSLKSQLPGNDSQKAIIHFEFVLVNKKNEHLGQLEIPMFPSGFEIQRSEEKTLSKKAKDKLTPLKYAIEYKISLQEREEKTYDNSQGFKIEASSISNYREKFPLTFDIVIYTGQDIAIDFKGNKILFEQKTNILPDVKAKTAQLDQTLEVALNVQMLQDRKGKELFKMYAVVIISIEKTKGKKEEYGWYAHQLFTADNIFFEGTFDELLYKPPFVANFPLDPKKARKLLSKIQFEVKEVKVSV